MQNFEELCAGPWVAQQSGSDCVLLLPFLLLLHRAWNDCLTSELRKRTLSMAMTVKSMKSFYPKAVLLVVFECKHLAVKRPCLLQDAALDSSL